MQTVHASIRAAAALALALLAAAGCRSDTYYKTLEVFGKHKRELLLERVEDGRDSQDESKQEFRDALEEFSAITGFKGSDLETFYKRLSGALTECEEQAEDVSERIDAIEAVAEDLFDEWERELAQYSSADLRRSSQKKLRDTREHYERMIKAMKRAEGKMEPVLEAFRDQVLFIKHNLNAQAIASLEDDVADLEDDVEKLLAEMSASIDEANEFIDAMGPGS
jgi:hypothetical protein